MQGADYPRETKIFINSGNGLAGSASILRNIEKTGRRNQVGPSERRCAILELLCQKRCDTIKHLATTFGVSERTIRYDLVVLACSYPIQTRPGPHGGVMVADWFHLDRRALSQKQVELLKRLLPSLEGEDAIILKSILTQFSLYGVS